jgi:hypothetical protein
MEVLVGLSLRLTVLLEELLLAPLDLLGNELLPAGLLLHL